jgi:cardiolipin synthase
MGEWINNALNYFWDYGLAYVFTLVGFALALVIIGRMLTEKRNPSNIFAWSFLIIFLPYVGVPLFLLFGGRKSRRLVKRKQEVLSQVLTLAGELDQEGAIIPERGQLINDWPGNTVRVLPDGVIAFNALRQEIVQARESIHIMSYIVGSDETGLEVIDLLTAKAREGVAVRLLLDSFGCLPLRSRYLRDFTAAGGQYARFMPLLPLHSHSSANLRNHRKIACFDSRRAIVGGQNIDRRFLAAKDHPDLFADLSILIEGPVLRPLSQIFAADWLFASQEDPAALESSLQVSPPIMGESPIEVIASGPDIVGDPLYERILHLIQESRKEVVLVTPYFIPDEGLFRTLVIKARAGRLITLIVPEVSNHKITDLARHHYLRELNEAGAKVLFYRGRVLHGKLLLVDKTTAMVGSANFDMRSLFVNFEIGLFLSRDADVAFLDDWVTAIRRDCVTFAQSRRANIKPRGRLAEDFAHLLGPLL